MRKLIIGNHSGHPAFFDMAGKFRRASDHWYGSGFKMGDRAAAYVWVSDWRMRNQHARVYITEDNVSPNTCDSRFLPATWMFAGIADEVWQLHAPNEDMPQPPGMRLYHTTMWKIWRWLLHNKIFVPSIRPLQASLEKANVLMKELGIPDRFVTLQPLFDATYDEYRNAPVGWWKDVCAELGKTIPVVVIGAARNASRMKLPRGCYPAWSRNLSPMDSLALISLAATHVGGETGTSIWSPILHVPTIAVYRVWRAHPGKKTDTRPLPFTKPVVYAPLEGPINEIVIRTRRMFDGHTTVSTPLED